MSYEDENKPVLIKEYDRYQTMHFQNLVSQDNTLAQLSLGLVTVMAAFGKDIIIVNKTLSYTMILMFTLTILQVVFGYFLANQFAIFAKSKLNENYRNRLPLNNGMDASIAGQLSSFFNITQFITFALGIISFAALITTYLEGL